MNSHLQLVKEKLQELAAKTDAVKKSEEFQHYLDTMAKFWEYSYHNQLLIYFRMPTASQVAGFKAWQELPDISIALKVLQIYRISTIIDSVDYCYQLK